MEKNKVFIIIFTLITCTIFGQTSYLRKIEKGKFGKAEKKLVKALKKDSNDIALNYTMSTLLLKRKNKGYNSAKSYQYLTKTESLYANLTDKKEINRLNKIPINTDVIQSYLDTICRYALTDASVKNTVESYENYLSYYTRMTSEYRNTAVEKRDIAAFKIASKENTVESYEKFISNYPDAKQFREAINKRDVAAFRVATKENTIESYQKFISNYPDAKQFNEAVTIRNMLAYKAAVGENSIASYTVFVKKYPDAKQTKEAWEKIYNLAYSEAKNTNTISAYEAFIVNYPAAKQVENATERIHDLAFNQAKAENKSSALHSFMEKYPKSREYTEAFKLYEKLQFRENTVSGNWESYKNFLQEYPKNSLVKQAKDSLLTLAFKTKDFNIVEYCLSTFCRDQNLIDLHFQIYTQDGELSTLSAYKVDYPENYPSQMADDLFYAEIADKFLLHLPYNPSNRNQYLEYIKNTRQKEMVNVVVQRMISPYLEKSDYRGALKFLDGIPVDKNTKFYKDLYSLLSSPVDRSIKPTALKGLNTKGNEFSPVPTADEKKIYFCGQNRNDNIGGEDIYVAAGYKGNFTQPMVESYLSTQNSNEAPVSISSDGTLMLLFKSGKIYYSSKTNYGWSGITELEGVINDGEWQGDAMISSDGNNILFSSVRTNEIFNTNKLSDKYYHGDILYPTDIFVSVRDEYGNWSDPINLGSSINTRYCERFPFLHPDMKTLYFSSDGHGGLGKMDVFKSTRLSDTCWNCWSEPINLGKEINTPENDAGYKISTSGDKAYFTKNNRKANETSVLFLLDVSGSMQGEKIEELKKVSKITCEDAINNNAEVAIAAFDGSCQNPLSYYLPFTRDYLQIENFIDNLVSNGGTPMYEAYFQASYLLADESNPKIKNKVMVLMTDGDANSCYRLEDILNKLKLSNKLFKTQTIAYQVNEYSKAYTDLDLISRLSHGDFFHAATTEELGAAFEKASGNIYEIVSGPDNKDLYSLNLPAHLRPDVVARVEGELKDVNNRPISTLIHWEDLESNKIIGTAKTDPIDGKYFIALPMGKNYGYFIEDTTYFPISQNLDLRDSANTVEYKKDIKVVSYRDMIEKGVAVSMNNLFFDFGKHDLLPSSIPELKRVSKIINRYKLKVEISGHTDNIGEDKNNQLLSERRSKSVKDFLIRSGCEGNLLKTIGYGESRPIDTNQNEIGRANNRRVEIRFMK